MPKQSIIDKLTNPSEEIQLTEQETLYIVQEWINTQFGITPESMRTHTYFESVPFSAMPSRLCHGVKLKTTNNVEA